MSAIASRAEEETFSAAEHAAEQATGIPRPQLRSKLGDNYAPFVRAYEPDPKNDPTNAYIRAARSGKLEIDGRFLVEGSRQRVQIRLREAEARAYAAGDLMERSRVFAQVTRRELQGRADKIIVKLKEAGGNVDALTASEEAFLKGVGCLEENAAYEEQLESFQLREAHGETSEPPQRFILREGIPDYDGGGGGLSPYGDGPGGYVGAGPLAFMDGAYQPFGQGPFGQQMYLAAQWDMLAKSFVVATHHPVARAVLETLIEFVLGAGVKVSSQNEKVNDCLKDFWKFNRMNWRMREWFRAKRRDGELFVWKIPLGDGSGRTKVRVVDPTWVWEIVTDAEDTEAIFYYRVQGATRTQLYTVDKPNKAGQSPTQVYVMRDMRPEEIIHRKINVGPAEVRGRSDFASILGWLGLLDDFFQAVVARERASAGVGIDVSVEGGQQDIDSVRANFVLPSVTNAGSANFHGKNVVVQDISFDPAQSVAPGSTFEGLMTMIGNGAVFPRAYLNAGGDDMTKAGTLTATAPFAKHVRGCQTEEREMLEELIADAMLEYVEAGVLSEADLKGAVIEIDFPEIVESDAVTEVPLIEQGVAMDYTCHKTSAIEYAKRLRIKNYDYDTEQLAIMAERNGPNAKKIGIWRNLAITFRTPQPLAGGQTGVGSGGAGTHPTDGAPDTSDDVQTNDGQAATIQQAQESLREAARELAAQMLREVTAEMVADAAKRVHPRPSDGQIEAGNYRKGHVQFPGFNVSIETKAGGTRSGVGADGKKWSVKMPTHYGYIKRTEGADGEQVDCYIGPHPDAPNVWVVDQVHHDKGNFDEHKALIGYDSIDEALTDYYKSFSDGKGPQRVGGVEKMTREAFKEWLAGDTKKAATLK